MYWAWQPLFHQWRCCTERAGIGSSTSWLGITRGMCSSFEVMGLYLVSWRSLSPGATQILHIDSGPPPYSSPSFWEQLVALMCADVTQSSVIKSVVIVPNCSRESTFSRTFPDFLWLCALWNNFLLDVAEFDLHRFVEVWILCLPDFILLSALEM